jgi:hypothetical protein
VEPYRGTIARPERVVLTPGPDPAVKGAVFDRPSSSGGCTRLEVRSGSRAEMLRLSISRLLFPTKADAARPPRKPPGLVGAIGYAPPFCAFPQRLSDPAVRRCLPIIAGRPRPLSFYRNGA